MRRRHAARKLHAQIHRGRHRGVEEIAQASDAEHVGDLVRIADRRGDAVREHAAIELERRDQRGLDMQMCVDEAGNHDLALDVDLAGAAIFRHRSDDTVVADRDVALDEFAPDEVEDAAALEDDVRLGEPASLFDRTGEIGDGVAHRGPRWEGWVYGQFPAGREKSREFRISRRFLPKYLAASPADE